MKDLKSKKYSPIYFLMGDESYYIDKVTNYIMNNVLSESEKSFNQTIMYGKDVEIGTVITAAKRFPMMCDHQVIIVKEAQNIKKIEDLHFYAKQPLKSTILVINYKYKTLDKRSKLYKALKNGTLLESKKLYDNKLPEWIKEYLSEKNISIDPPSSLLLAENLGNDLNKISNELDKLIITLPDDEKKITSKHIEQNIGISKDYNTFELNNALTNKDVLKANRIVNYFAANEKEHHISLTIASIFYYFSKVFQYHFLPDKNNSKAVASALGVHPFFVNDYKKAAQKYKPPKIAQIFSDLREYDLKSKGVENNSATQGDLQRELIFKILH